MMYRYIDVRIVNDNETKYDKGDIKCNLMHSDCNNHDYGDVCVDDDDPVFLAAPGSARRGQFEGRGERGSSCVSSSDPKRRHPPMLIIIRMTSCDILLSNRTSSSNTPLLHHPQISNRVLFAGYTYRAPYRKQKSFNLTITDCISWYRQFSFVSEIQFHGE